MSGKLKTYVSARLQSYAKKSYDNTLNPLPSAFYVKKQGSVLFGDDITTINSLMSAYLQQCANAPSVQDFIDAIEIASTRYMESKDSAPRDKNGKKIKDPQRKNDKALLTILFNYIKPQYSLEIAEYIERKAIDSIKNKDLFEFRKNLFLTYYFKNRDFYTHVSTKKVYQNIINTLYEQNWKEGIGFVKSQLSIKYWYHELLKNAVFIALAQYRSTEETKLFAQYYDVNYAQVALPALDATKTPETELLVLNMLARGPRSSTPASIDGTPVLFTRGVLSRPDSGIPSTPRNMVSLVSPRNPNQDDTSLYTPLGFHKK